MKTSRLLETSADDSQPPTSNSQTEKHGGHAVHRVLGVGGWEILDVSSLGGHQNIHAPIPLSALFGVIARHRMLLAIAFGLEP